MFWCSQIPFYWSYSSFQRRTRRFSSASDSANETGRWRLTRLNGSPSATQHAHLKIKATNVLESSPPSKKKKSYNAVDDPARKYCLGKLEELFYDVFRRYPHVRSETTDEDMDVNDSKGKIIPKKIGELSEEEMEALINEANLLYQNFFINHSCKSILISSFVFHSWLAIPGSTSSGSGFIFSFRRRSIRLHCWDREELVPVVSAAELRNL